MSTLMIFPLSQDEDPSMFTNPVEGRPELSPPHGEELEEADETSDLRPALLQRQAGVASQRLQGFL